MKISKEQYDYIHKDLFLIDYINKIITNEYFYWRGKNEIIAKKFLHTRSDLEYVRHEIYKKRSAYVRASNELDEFNKLDNEQLKLNI